MTHYYAQLNTDGIVQAVTQTAGFINSYNMIRIDSLDESLLGMKYENGNFYDVGQTE